MLSIGGVPRDNPRVTSFLVGLGPKETLDNYFICSVLVITDFKHIFLLQNIFGFYVCDIWVKHIFSTLLTEV